LVAGGAQALISFGLAGGLVPGLPAGSVIIAESVCIDDALYSADANLAALFGGFTFHRVFSPADAITDPAGKASAAARTGAHAVDLESGAVARTGLPFAVIRAICDPADRALPTAALAGVDSTGGIALGPLLRALLASPGQIPALIGLGFESAAAHRGLARVCSTFQKRRAGASR